MQSEIIDKKTKLWNSAVTQDNYGSKEQYYDHALKQYLMYVEMADRISNRRGLANSFFLTLNSLALTGIGLTYQSGVLVNDWFLLFPLIWLLLICIVWLGLLKSYQRINTAKFQVIGEYESNLPTQPYVVAEWGLLGQGKDPDRHRTLSEWEQIIPIVLTFTYIVATLFIILV